MPPLLYAFLDGIVQKGTLEVETSPGKRFFVGDGSGEQIAVRLADPAAARQLLLRPELALGELYMDGRLRHPRAYRCGTARKRFPARRAISSGENLRYLARVSAVPTMLTL
jgi:hypothetical protein